MIELERTFLAKELPSDLKECNSKEILDVYYPKSQKHPVIRLRRDGNRLMLTKKEPIEGSHSKLKEYTIPLTQVEFNEFLKLDGKKVHKIRYNYPHQNLTAEFDVFIEELKGLVLIDFEFETEEEKDGFVMPDYCLIDITDQEFTAGGKLAGKSYKDIQEKLIKFGYKQLFL